MPSLRSAGKGPHDEAETWIRKNLGDYDIRSNTEELELLAAILNAQNNDAEKRQVLDILARKEELSTFAEILETGLEDQHRYKVGLKLAKEDDGEGVLVMTAYEQYPFARASVPLVPGGW